MILIPQDLGSAETVRISFQHLVVLSNECCAQWGWTWGHSGLLSGEEPHDTLGQATCIPQTERTWATASDVCGKCDLSLQHRLTLTWLAVLKWVELYLDLTFKKPTLDPSEVSSQQKDQAGRWWRTLCRWQTNAHSSNPVFWSLSRIVLQALCIENSLSSSFFVDYQRSLVGNELRQSGNSGDL